MGTPHTPWQPSGLLVDYARLEPLARERSGAHAAAAPFPHSCIDEFLDPQAARAIEAAIPIPGEDRKWDFYYAAGFEEKWAISDYLALPAPVRQLVSELNAGPFVRFLESLTGIEHLLPDPHLHGGGVHLVKRGGVLQVHSDFNWSERLQAHRRVNLFVYFNPAWQEAWGGALELWDSKCERSVASYLPLFNRVVIFSARSDTFHGHPTPLQCPEGVWRKSIALYYYTTDRPPGEKRDPHNTIYKGLHI